MTMGCIFEQHYHCRRPLGVLLRARVKDPVQHMETSIFTTSEKARVTKSAMKKMFIFFFDVQGVVLAHGVPQGQTVNAAYYSKVRIIKYCI